MPKKISADKLLNIAAQHDHQTEKAVVEGLPILALDYGEKYCGLAVAPDGVTVLPAAVVQTQKLDSALESLMLDYTIKILVIGLPLSANRAENHICVIIRILADKLQKKFPKVSVQLVNERFSSQAVMSPDNKRIDDLAAMQILDFYLAQSKK